MKTFYLRTLGLRMLALVVATAPVLPAAESLAPTKAARPWVSDRLSVCVYCGASDLAPPKYAEYARQLGIKTVWLESNRVLTPALTMYERVGFREQVSSVLASKIFIIRSSAPGCKQTISHRLRV